MASATSLAPDDRTRLTEKTKAMGLYGLGIPPEFGGPEIDLVTRTLIAIEMSQHRDQIDPVDHLGRLSPA